MSGNAPFQGFSFSHREGEIKIQGNSIATNEKSVPWGKTSGSIVFTRTDDKLYYDNTFLIDFSNIAGQFNAPLSFGANIDKNGNPRRFSTTDMSNMKIKLKYDYSEIASLALPSPTRTGYIFGGWYTESSGGTRITTPTIALLANKTIYAHWIDPSSVVEYVVTFDANGGTGNMSNQIIQYGSPTALNTNTYTKDEFDFVGWNTSPNGTGTSYSDGQSVTDIGKIILYAQWKERTYDVMFNYGSENFVGNNYINSDIELFSTNNIHKDFEVTTTISNFVFLPNQTSNRNTFITNHYEKTSPYQGFSFIYREGSIKAQGNSTQQGEKFIEWGQTSGTVDFKRIDNVLYFNDTFLIDFNNIKGPFAKPLVFGTNLDENDNPRRYCIADFSDIIVKIALTKNEILNLSLPNPTRTGYTFDGWYTAATGGTKITTPTMQLLAGKTIYAHWISNNQNNQNNQNNSGVNNLNTMNSTNSINNINSINNTNNLNDKDNLNNNNIDTNTGNEMIQNQTTTNNTQTTLNTNNVMNTNTITNTVTNTNTSLNDIKEDIVNNKTNTSSNKEENTISKVNE